MRQKRNDERVLTSLQPIALFFVSSSAFLSPGMRPDLTPQFPQAGTTGCTREACAFRDAKAENQTFKRHPELEVVGISGGKSV